MPYKKAVCRTVKLAVLLLLCLSLILGSGLKVYTCAPRSSQSDYPKLPLPTYCMVYQNMEQLAARSDLILDATILEVTPDQLWLPVPGEGFVDAGTRAHSIPDTRMKGKLLRLRVNRTVAGRVKACDPTVFLHTNSLYFLPDFQPGERLVFLLEKDTGNTFGPVYQGKSFFYIAADSRVYPTHVLEDTIPFSGMELHEFLQFLRCAVRGARPDAN